jgi:D-lyxose ketol-isomerase
MSKNQINRRRLLKTTGISLAGAAVANANCGSCGPEESSCEAEASCSKPKLSFNNADFYDKKGKFLPEKGKEAYITLMKYHGYPVYPGIEEKLWVSDYGTGQFAKLGLGANMFVNNEEDHYMLMDLFLLPNQMLPEHYHLKTDKNPAKMEGWLVRHGLSYVYGEGEPARKMKAVVPKCHMKGKVTVEHEVILKEGEFTPLNRATARHWQFGGPEGAIINEVATVHDDNGVRHSDKNLVFP